MILIGGRNIQGKKFRKRKNPNLKGEEFIDDKFIAFLVTSFTLPEDLSYAKKVLSYALIYKNIGNSYCEDCSDEAYKQGYISCSCEYCSECKQNICACDLSSRVKLRKYIINLAIKYLDLKQLKSFKNQLQHSDFENEYSTYIKKLDNHIKI